MRGIKMIRYEDMTDAEKFRGLRYRYENTGVWFIVYDSQDNHIIAQFKYFHQAQSFMEYMNNAPVYHFTRQQLMAVFGGVIDIMIEYRDKHGYMEDTATIKAVREILEGADAEYELFLQGECNLRSQLMRLG
jgi:hypothetical protein